MNFINFKTAVAKAFSDMTKNNQQLFRTTASKDDMWTTYLSSYPDGTNPIFRERREYDCSCCRQFIRNVGNVVTIVDNKLVSIWDCKVQDEAYQTVADAMSEFVKSHPIDNKFLHFERIAGTDKNYEEKDGEVYTWNHFFVNIPVQYVMPKATIATNLGEFRALHDVLLRSINEITEDSVDTVLELIAQNSLYRGDDHKATLNEFSKLQKKFKKLKDDKAKDLFVWTSINDIHPAVSKIRNTSIGTLLVDISEGKELEYAVKAFETIVAPTNYKRPTALVTKSMVEAARKKIEELGLSSALERRYANLSDITVNNILFANRDTRKIMTDAVNSAFDDIASSAVKPKSFDKVEEIGIEKFLSDVLPKAKNIEILMENRHQKNLMSLIAPVDPTAGNLFKWNNNFSWSYTGDLADSLIKERVKKAGGSIEGVLCCRLAWFNHDDLDLHMEEPNSGHIYYANRQSYSGGELDVDMNVSDNHLTREAVENIFYRDSRNMREGVYTLRVHNFNKRETKDVGFEVEVDIQGTLYHFEYSKAVPSREFIDVMKLKYSKETGFTILSSLEGTSVSRNIWGISTNQFHKVNVIMMSPNYWDDQKGIGNKHYFFMIDGCMNDGQARGFFNEFLKSELDAHRKVIEIVGSKMKTEITEDQLSGMGFSSTQRNQITVRVTGATSRVLKINF